MVVLRARQDYDGIFNAYSDLLKADTTVSADTQATDDKIKQEHEECKDRLQKMSLLFDVVISPTDFTLEALKFLRKDFQENIFNKTRIKENKYFEDKENTMKNLRSAREHFANAISAKHAIINYKPDNIVIRDKHAEFYDCINSCIDCFEAALEDWNFTLPNQRQSSSGPDMTLRGNLHTKKEILQKMLDDLDTANPDEIQSSSIGLHETELREIIADLREIPKHDENTYIRSKPDSMKHIRDARKLLDLALDEFDLMKQTFERQVLHRYLNDCVPCLDRALASW